MDKKLIKRINNLKEDINIMEAGTKDPNTPADMRSDLEASVIEARKELEKLEKKAEKIPAEQPKKVKKPHKKKDKPPKAKVRIADKDIKDITAQECLDAYNKRREQAKKSAKKSKTRSVISKIATHLGTVAEQAIRSIPASEIKEQPATAIKDIKKIGDIVEGALSSIRNILKKYVESSDLKISAEAKKDLESFENLATELKKKYVK